MTERELVRFIESVLQDPARWTDRLSWPTHYDDQSGKQFRRWEGIDSWQARALFAAARVEPREATPNPRGSE